MATGKPSILVPYDATELSIKALDKAIEIASRMEKFISNITDLEKTKKYLVNLIKEGAEKCMTEVVGKIKEKELFVKYIIRVGHPDDEILEVSKNPNIHLIVMGCSGSFKKRHNRRGVGSISRWISEVASCPVVLMR